MSAGLSRVLLLDQRGTGHLTPVTAQGAARSCAEDQAEYLRHFRADNIVRDAEAIRRKPLIGRQAGRSSARATAGSARCATCRPRLRGSRRCSSPAESRRSRGPPTTSIRATYPRVAEKNRRYFERYPAGRRACPRDRAPPARRTTCACRAGAASLWSASSSWGSQFRHERRLRDHPLPARKRRSDRGVAAAREISWNFLHQPRARRSRSTPTRSSRCCTRRVTRSSRRRAGRRQRLRGRVPGVRSRRGGPCSSPAR